MTAALPDVTLTETTADMLTTSVRHRLGNDRLLVRSLLVVPRALVAPAADTTDAPADNGASASDAPRPPDPPPKAPVTTRLPPQKRRPAPRKLPPIAAPRTGAVQQRTHRSPLPASG